MSEKERSSSKSKSKDKDRSSLKKEKKSKSDADATPPPPPAAEQSAAPPLTNAAAGDAAAAHHDALEKEAEAHKDKGNTAWAEGKSEEAIVHYTHAINVGRTSQLHVYLSNRSAAYVAVGDFVSALDDATRSVDLNPNWWKGYLRKGTALLALGRFAPAADVFRAGLKLKAGNEFLMKGLEQAEEGIEKRKQAAAASAAAAAATLPTEPSDGPSDELSNKLKKQASKATLEKTSAAAHAPQLHSAAAPTEEGTESRSACCCCCFFLVTCSVCARQFAFKFCVFSFHN